MYDLKDILSIEEDLLEQVHHILQQNPYVKNNEITTKKIFDDSILSKYTQMSFKLETVVSKYGTISDRYSQQPGENKSSKSRSRNYTLYKPKTPNASQWKKRKLDKMSDVILSSGEKEKEIYI